MEKKLLGCFTWFGGIIDCLAWTATAVPVLGMVACRRVWGDPLWTCQSLARHSDEGKLVTVAAFSIIGLFVVFFSKKKELVNRATDCVKLQNVRPKRTSETNDSDWRGCLWPRGQAVSQGETRCLSAFIFPAPFLSWERCGWVRPWERFTWPLTS